ncbi:AzlD domain-containing protein [Gorillibacterium sp. CAU 1737]|uniref:AzlD domain-containing protein n=1 Tax=Gorillibacterium sp. CAU 1737 TaxID=3140362 RepID=UPI00325FFD24
MNTMLSAGLAVLGMAVVTYIPRLLPLLFTERFQVTGRLRLFLDYLPYAVLSALVFPAIFTSTGDAWTGTAGALAAFLLSLAGLPIIVVVFGGIGAAMLTGWLL